jgi:hypothetical protein
MNGPNAPSPPDGHGFISGRRDSPTVSAPAGCTADFAAATFGTTIEVQPFGMRANHSTGRRRSDLPDFVQTDINVDALAHAIFARYAGAQQIVIEGIPSLATFFRREYCPDFRVMKLAGELALRVNQLAVAEADRPDGIRALRVTVREIMLAALLHDLGKQHEDCAPFIELMRKTDLRGVNGGDGARRADLLQIVRDVHCRKGPCMIDRLRDAGRAELNNPFIATVARRHGEDYDVNRSARLGCWWAREINVVTIADDYEAVTSEGPERAYRPERNNAEEAVRMLREGAERGRYEPGLIDIFINDVIGVRA